MCRSWALAWGLWPPERPGAGRQPTGDYMSNPGQVGGGDSPGPAGQRAQGHRKAACAHPKGKGLRPLVGARRLA